MTSFEERLKEAREKAKKLDAPTSWQDTKTNTFQQTVNNDLNKTGNTLVQQQRNQKSAEIAARAGGSLMEQATVETPKQSPFKTAFDVVDRGAGYFNQGVASTIDFVANAMPRLEGAVFGVDPAATFTGQVLKPVTDATGKFKDWVDQTVAGIDQRVQADTKDNKAASIAANLGSQAVAALPNAVLAFLSGGGSAATQLTAQSTGVSGAVTSAATKALQNPLTKVSFAQSLGNGYEEAKASGASDVEAMTAATLSSLFNSAIETGGGIEALPGEIRGKDLSTAKKALEWVKSALEEGGEEVVQGVITGLTNKGVFDNEKKLYSNTDENAVINPSRMLQEFGSGAAVGGILGGGQMLGNAILNSGGRNTPKPTVEGVMPEPKQEAQAQPPVADITPTVQQEQGTISDATPAIREDAKPAMGAADSGFDPYSHASLEHGAIEPGENPARVVDVPKSVDGETNVMQTVRTIMEADATPDAAIPELEQAIVKGKFSKMPITDQAAATRADDTIRRVGYQQALADWRAEVRSGKVSKDSVVVGEALYNAAVNAKDYKSAVKIAVELSTQVRSAAQALQAIRMLKKMSPSAQLYGVKQSVDNLQKTLTDKYGKRAPSLKINEELAAKFLEAETEADRKTAEEALYKDIAKQIPATFADKWNAWRYLSMLGNVRTHARNTLGNAMFAPVRFVKNKVGAAMEAGAQAAGLIDQSQRTKAFGAAGKDLMTAAKADYENVKQQVLSAGKYNSSSDIIEENRRIFDSVFLETLRQGNSKALEAEDSFFSKGAYASSLASYLKAQGFTAADFTGNGMTAQQKDAARSYAIKEAQKATYRDINAFSEAISSIGFKAPGDNKAKHAVNALVEGIMPFKKTPANILARGVEYSPAGLAKTLFLDSRQVKNGKITAAEYMDHLASGLTGSGLFALGWLLSNMGLLVGGTPEDEDQADLEGRQPYALEVDGKSITLDWLAPEAMPVFMGVELAEAIREGGGDASLTDKVLSFIKGLSGPMLEMSMMSSLQDALEATEYADNKPLAFLANGALGYLKQAQPTLFGQLERALGSRVRETTFTQEGDKYLNKDAQYMVGSAANKIPFYDYNQVPYIDAWGRTEDLGGTGERLFNNLLNPAYVSDIQETPVDVEIKRLEEALGVNLTPSRAEKTLTIDKQKIILTADEYITYAQAKGQNDLTFRQNLIGSDLYSGLDDETKAKAMERAKDFANVLAIQEAGFEPKMSDWQKELIGADAETITGVFVAKALESQAGVIDKQEGDDDKGPQAYFRDLLDALEADKAEKRKIWVDAGYAKSTCPY